jgi:hypothetical protein
MSSQYREGRTVQGHGNYFRVAHFGEDRLPGYPILRNEVNYGEQES